MNEPIIAPIFFYWLQLIDRIGIVAMSVFIMATSVAVILPIIMCCFWSDSYSSGSWQEWVDSHPACVRWTKRCAVMSILSLVFIVFVPTKKTVVSMSVAKAVTPQNIESAKDTVKSGIDYMFDKIKDLNGEKSESKKSE